MTAGPASPTDTLRLRPAAIARGMGAVVAARFAVAAVLYLSGAIGLEMVDALFYERVEARTLLIDGFNAVEEILEMLGITVFAWALAHEIARRRATVAFDAGRRRWPYAGGSAARHGGVSRLPATARTPRRADCAGASPA